MNAIVVDDQLSVLKGIKNGVHFERYGISEVSYAMSAAEARALMAEKPYDIILCDIEMPGENGLELNRWIAAQYPDMIRILLTSHAEFTYAQESVKLGCFDYILQPAPYDEIESCLERAVKEIRKRKERERLYQSGIHYETYQLELNDRLIMNLFSPTANNADGAMLALNQSGIPIRQTSSILVSILDIEPYYPEGSERIDDLSTRKDIVKSLNESGISAPVYSLIALNRSKQFMVLLMSNEEGLPPTSHDIYEHIYRSLQTTLGFSPAYYVGSLRTMESIHDGVTELVQIIKDNARQKAGLYFSGTSDFTKTLPDLDSNLRKWHRLMDANQLEQAETAMLSYIDFVSTTGTINFNAICDIHQQITQLLFNYAYDHEIDILSLFSDEYSYDEFTEAYANIKALKKAVSYTMEALIAAAGMNRQKSDIELAKDFIHSHLSDNISVKEVADSVYRTPEYFTTLFKKETGMNLKAYIQQEKINAAKIMLNNPDIPISVIATETGYSNFSHFTQVFKKYEGMTPSEYRSETAMQK